MSAPVREGQVNWSEAVGQFLELNQAISEPVRGVLDDLRTRGPFELTRALEASVAEAARAESIRFLLFVIEHALEDHALSDDEVRALSILRRVFRVEEGDLARSDSDAVARLLCQEAALIFDDQAITPAEAVHKARLQEVFGLGYDDFIRILEPEIDRLMMALLERLDGGAPETWSGTDWEELRNRIAAISLVRHVQALRQPDPTRAGYIYLLLNPSMPGIVKVGRTSHPPKKRAAELAGATGVPTPFIVVFDLFVPDQFAAEAFVHEQLAERGARVAENREFFAVEPSEAVRVMLEAKDQL